MYEVTNLSVDLREGIVAKPGSWQFGGQVSHHFDSHVERSVPGYREGHELIAQISDSFLRQDSLCYELGCSTGTLTKLLGDRHVDRGVKVQGIDFEADMVALAQERCADLTNVTIVCGDVTKMAFQPADMIIAYYTIQFIDQWARLPLLQAVFRALNPGGAFLLFEKVRPPHPRVQDIITHIYYDFKLSNGFTAEEIMAKARSLKGVLDPLSSAENAALLKRAGFRAHAPIFHMLCFEGVLAIKQ